MKKNVPARRVSKSSQSASREAQAVSAKRPLTPEQIAHSMVADSDVAPQFVDIIEGDGAFSNNDRLGGWDEIWAAFVEHHLNEETKKTYVRGADPMTDQWIGEECAYRIGVEVGRKLAGAQ
jgi:hypothetical protein